MFNSLKGWQLFLYKDPTYIVTMWATLIKYFSLLNPYKQISDTPNLYNKVRPQLNTHVLRWQHKENSGSPKQKMSPKYPYTRQTL